MIPIKGYATFHPLKHCMIGRHFSAEFFIKNIKEKKIADPLARIADEMAEDYDKLETLLKSYGVKTYRPDFNENKFSNNFNVMPPVCPRDHFAVVGETFYSTQQTDFYGSVIKNIHRNNLHLKNYGSREMIVSTATVVRVGKDIFWDTGKIQNSEDAINKIKLIWTEQGFRVHESKRGYHSDSAFCCVKPGCLVSLHDVQNYKELFPNWEVLYLPDQSWHKMHDFLKMKDQVHGKWWLEGEEHNQQLIHYVNTWLQDWVGYVEETVFDVNMLSIDENTIICNNYNKKVFEFFKRHKVEPIVFNFRHRYFWDGGVHCITQDFYREGEMEDYFG